MKSGSNRTNGTVLNSIMTAAPLTITLALTGAAASHNRSTDADRKLTPAALGAAPGEWWSTFPALAARPAHVLANSLPR